jgi:methionyl-tRNA formyltransferase
MDVAILMNQHSCPGREYTKHLTNTNITFDVIVVGDYPEVNELEEERCDGRWTPPKITSMIESSSIHNFNSLGSDELLAHIRKHQYDVGVQGGTGFIGQNLIDAFDGRILNFHPGDLPAYRGSSAPERQVLDDKDIIGTCHILVTELDAGPVIRKRRLSLDMDSYHAMRASIYPELAKFVCDILNELNQGEELFANAEPQDESKAECKSYIGDDRIEHLKDNWNNILQ